MSIKLNLGNWGGIFPLPNIVVDKYIKRVSSDQLKVLMYMFRHCEEVLNEGSVGKAVGIKNEDDVKDAVRFWINEGIITKEGEIPAPSAQQESDNTVAISDNNSYTEIKEKKKPRPLSRAQKPDSIFVSERLTNNEELSALLNEVQLIFGKPISGGDTATLVMLHETDGLPCNVLLMLVQYCHSIGKGNMRYIERVAVQWAADDIITIERAEKKIKDMEMYGEAWNTVARIFGIQNSGSPTKAQKENANRWLNQWGFSEEMLREAYERCVNTKNTFNITYTNGILKNWKKYNISSLKELKDFEDKKSTTNKQGKSRQQVSYDIEEYEEFSMFD